MHNKEKMQEAIYLISQLNRLQEDQETSPAMKRLIRAYIRSHLKAIHDEEEKDDLVISDNRS